MDNIFVQDVCEVYLKEPTVGTQYFFGLTTKNEITQKIKQDFLKGGIGNGTVGVVQSDKEITFKVSTLLHNDSLFEIQSGTEFASSTTTKTMYSESVICTVAGKVTPLLKVGVTTVTPNEGTVIVMDGKGKAVAGTWASPDFTATTPADIAVGSAYTVFYQITNANAQVLLLDSKKFPKNYYVELHTIAYDVDKNVVVADIYWQFNKALPDGGIQAQYEAGKSNGDEVAFTAQLLAGSSSYGNYVVVPRA